MKEFYKFGPIQIINGTALSIWVWRLLITIDGKRVSFIWDAD